MYAFPSMIDMTKISWTSPAHKQVVISLLIGNGRIDTLDDLIHYATIINSLTEKQVKSLTYCKAAKLGIPIN